MKSPFAVYLHLFALLVLGGMTLWIIKDLWILILIILALAGLALLALSRWKR